MSRSVRCKTTRSTTALNNGKDLTTKDGACPNLNEVAWYWENEDHQRKSVMGKRGNAWNLYDMHGNTWEWCSDYYGDYGEDLQVDPTGAASGSRRVHRGGSGYSHAQGCRSAFRDNESEDYSHYWLSFRPVRILSD